MKQLPACCRIRKLSLAIILLAGPTVGCLRASQAARSTPAQAQRSIVERLSELLAPQKVQVSAESMSPAESTGTRELRVKWGTGSAISTPDQPKTGPPPAGVFSIAAQQRYAEAPARQRALEIAAGRILIVGVDRSSRLKSWSVMADPRVIRSEGPGGPDGTLTGQVLHMEQAEFFLTIPDAPDIVELRLYEPQLNGTEYRLVPVGTIPLSR